MYDFKGSSLECIIISKKSLTLRKNIQNIKLNIKNIKYILNIKILNKIKIKILI